MNETLDMTHPRLDSDENNEEKIEEAKPPTLEDMIEYCNKLANPKCKKCDGRGYIGFITNKLGRVPVPCTAKSCMARKHNYIQREIKRQQLKKQLEEEAKKKEQENDTDTTAT